MFIVKMMFCGSSPQYHCTMKALSPHDRKTCSVSPKVWCGKLAISLFLAMSGSEWSRCVAGNVCICEVLKIFKAGVLTVLLASQTDDSLQLGLLLKINGNIRSVLSNIALPNALRTCEVREPSDALRPSKCATDQYLCSTAMLHHCSTPDQNTTLEIHCSVAKMSTLSTVRGLSIAASFFTAGSLASYSLSAIPAILRNAEHESVDARMLAQQFEIGYKIGKITQVPAELFSIITFGFLAWHSRTTSTDALSWKLYAAAAATMFSVVPYTLAWIEQDSLKIVSLTQQSNTHPSDTEAKLEHGSDLAEQATATGQITPVEEFEPYEDSPFSGAEYEKLKTRKLLERLNSRNIYRIIATTLAGGLAMSAITTRVTLVTIVQGQ
ncbi:hypothetical protein MRB53_041555 [Persea americana]|nr:hypothetical protein MRB53_041555 [Persea americana]